MGFRVAAFMAAAVSLGPGMARSAPSVVDVHPSKGCVPANLLRIHVTFDEAMDRGSLREGVRLFRHEAADPTARIGWERADIAPESASGGRARGKLPGVADRPIPAFLSLRDELWNQDQTTATLLLDPGRIKRGVGPHQVGGPPLVAGHRYALVVSAPLRSASDGQPVEPYRSVLCVRPPERRRIDIQAWALGPVRRGTQDPLTLNFGRLMDPGGISGRLRVVKGSGEAVAGILEFGEDDQSVRFEPLRPWQPGEYEVVADPALEDSAGNRLDAPFDIDLTAARAAPVRTKLSFRPH